jgi:hypothetical protein
MSSVIRNIEGRNYFVYNISSLRPELIAFGLPELPQYAVNNDLNDSFPRYNYLLLLLLFITKKIFVFSMHSFARGSDQIGGKIVVRIISPPRVAFNAVFIYIIPWQIRVYLHTLSFVCNGKV